MNVLRISELRKTVKRRANRVERISPSQRLGNDVVGAHELDHRSHGPPAMMPVPSTAGFKRTCSPPNRPWTSCGIVPDLSGTWTRFFLACSHGFRDGDRHFRSFAFADADPALSITHDNQRAEIESLSTFHDFRHPVDKDNLILQAQFIWIDSHAFLLFPSPIRRNRQI